MIMKKLLTLTVVVFSTFILFESSRAQPLKCPPEGSGKPGDPPLTIEKQEFNKRKNRSSEEPSITPVIYSIDYLLKGTQPVHDEDSFTEGTYVEINDAYLMEFKEQGAEDCNCHLADASKGTGDVHIYLCTLSNLATAYKKYSLVVEITPSYKTLHPNYKMELKALKGKKVTVRGYLFYDEHQGNSINYCKKCNDKSLWRKTCWEIHPVTYIAETK
jgi:hypothetical protein